jgi:hypothetical protein
MGGLAIYGLFGFSSNAQKEVPAQFVCFGIGDLGALPVFAWLTYQFPDIGSVISKFFQPGVPVIKQCAGASILIQNSIAARTSDGRLSNARQIASRLSILGRFAPRSMELICEMLSLVAAARSLRDQSRSTRNILM